MNLPIFGTCWDTLVIRIDFPIDSQVDWQVGQQLVVVTTAWTDDPEDHQNELRSISAVSGAQPGVEEITS